MLTIGWDILPDLTSNKVTHDCYRFMLRQDTVKIIT